MLFLWSSERKKEGKKERKWNLSVVPDSLQHHGVEPARLLCPWDFPGKNTGVGYCFLLQGIFLTQGLNLGLLHCRQSLYCLSHQGSPGDPMDVEPMDVGNFIYGSSAFLNPAWTSLEVHGSRTVEAWLVEFWALLASVWDECNLQ